MFADVAPRIFDRRNWMLKPSMHSIAPSHLRHDRRYASSVRPSSIVRITAATTNAIRIISFSIFLLPVCVRPPPSVAHALEHRVKLAVHNQRNLDLPGQRRCTRLFQ
jgi:hypothetical protein